MSFLFVWVPFDRTQSHQHYLRYFLQLLICFFFFTFSGCKKVPFSSARIIRNCNFSESEFYYFIIFLPSPQTIIQENWSFSWFSEFFMQIDRSLQFVSCRAPNKVFIFCIKDSSHEICRCNLRKNNLKNQLIGITVTWWIILY